MNRRFTATSLILVLLVLLISACGGKKAAEESEVKPAETVKAAESETTTNEDADVKETSENVSDNKDAADKKTKKTADGGYVKDGIYTNDYFGLTVQMPKEWEVQGQDAMQDVMQTGKDIIANGDDDKQAALDEAEQKILNFFLTSKYPMNEQDINPSVISNAEKVSPLQVRNGKQYLEASQAMLKTTELPYEFDEIKTVNLGGKDFHMMTATLKGNGITLNQRYYSTLTDGYAVNFISTYFDDASKAETDKVIQSVKFE
ncbi:hypothetical protein P4H66_20500 [Paenibacillus dokdonensis]|uniref:PsbP C-terminal domain-containing protein n=1 Tax=Paenibacillus dokdonensis TaxID=2567944 RepID=A0ABU6GS59_9BACL|nr:hypothetical protein [Paenibacillus dokdonensis]MEC0242189.1 hypothetical protein [Paenibacillus dokdonensis]